MTGAIATTIAVGVATGVAGAVVSKALTSKPKAAAPAPVLAPPPEVAAPTLAPVVNDQAVQDAKRKSLLSQTSRGGRSSTILSDASDKLGG